MFDKLFVVLDLRPPGGAIGAMLHLCRARAKITAPAPFKTCVTSNVRDFTIWQKSASRSIAWRTDW